MSGKRKKRATAVTPAAPRPVAPVPVPARDWAAFWSGLVPFLGLVAVTLLAYLPSINGGVLWDDDSHITKPAMQSLHGLWRIWFNLGATQQYYPLLHSAFWMEHRLWGDATFGYHLVNILLHALSACLVVLIARRLALPGAWLAGFLFALHPVTAESVAWISEQKSTLSGVLCLGSALVYLKFDESRRRRDYVVALALFVAALAAKSVTATLPAALLVILWWRRGSLRKKEDVEPLAPWLALGMAAGLLTAWVERTYIGAHGAKFDLSFGDRILIAGRALWFYASKLLWPVNLTFIYPHWKVDAAVWWQWLFPLGAVFAIGALAWLARSRNVRGPLAAVLLFAGTLFPALGFLNVYPFRYSYVADHFQYLACLGLLVPLAAVLARAAQRVTQPRAIAALAIVPLVLGTLTFRQSRMYRDSETLYRETLARNPECWMAHDNLAAIYGKAGRTEDAIAEYRVALGIDPNVVEAQISLGNELLKLPGHQAEGLEHLQKALVVDDRFADAHFNLAVALAALPGRSADAAREYEEAIRDGEDTPEVRANLGTVLLQIPGRETDALQRFQEAVERDPGSAVAQNNLAMALARDPARIGEAIGHYETALKVQPDYPEAHMNLGIAFAQAGRMEEAIGEQREAIRLRPGFAPAHMNLAIVLAGVQGQEATAQEEARAALTIDPNLAEAHYTLALMLSDLPGRTAEAMAEYREALRIRPDYMEAHNNLGQLLVDTPGRAAEAVGELEAALRVSPLAETHYNLARALAQLGRRGEAIGHLEEALREQPDAEPVKEMLAKLRAGR